MVDVFGHSKISNMDAGQNSIATKGLTARPRTRRGAVGMPSVYESDVLWALE